MRGLIIRVVLGAMLVVAVLVPVSAAPSCGNCPPTLVTVNGDGSVTASTTAVGKTDCVIVPNYGKGTCVLKVYAANSLGIYPTDGGPTTVSPRSCPCTAQFWEHAGQWHPYSAPSEMFTP